MPLSTRHIHPNVPSISTMPGHAPATSGRWIVHWRPARLTQPLVRRSSAVRCVLWHTCQFVPGVPEMAFQPDKHPAGAGRNTVPQGARISAVLE
jgi:hypothetical protein